MHVEVSPRGKVARLVGFAAGLPSALDCVPCLVSLSQLDIAMTPGFPRVWPGFLEVGRAGEAVDVGGGGRGVEERLSVLLSAV